MAQETIRDVKKRLAAAYPDVEFTYTTTGRVARFGPMIEWTGGPTAEEVRSASECTRQWRKTYSFRRNMTDDEAAAECARYEAERPAREAEALAAKIARREAGKASGTASRKRNGDVKAKLRERFMGTAFSLTMYRGWCTVSWVDGPDREAVASVLGDGFLYERRQSQSALQHARLEALQDVGNKRLARRLERARTHPGHVAAGMARKRLAVTQEARKQVMKRALPLFDFFSIPQPAAVMAMAA